MKKADDPEYLDSKVRYSIKESEIRFRDENKSQA